MTFIDALEHSPC